MTHFIRPKPGLVLSSPHVVRALSRGPRYHCAECGATMFVRCESGLCPHCYDGRRTAHAAVGEVLYDVERSSTDDLHAQ